MSGADLHLGVLRFLPFVLLSAIAACAAPGSDAPDRERGDAGGKPDDLDETAACPEVVDRSRGVANGAIDLGALHDPIDLGANVATFLDPKTCALVKP